MHHAEEQALRLQRLRRHEESPTAQRALDPELPARICCCCWAEAPEDWNPAEGKLGGVRDPDHQFRVHHRRGHRADVGESSRQTFPKDETKKCGSRLFETKVEQIFQSTQKGNANGPKFKLKRFIY